MLKHHLKTAFLTLARYKLYSSISILGLTLGITAFLAILQYVYFEWSYDDFHQNAQQTYRIRLDRVRNGELDQSAGCAPLVGPAIKETFSEVADYCRLHNIKYLNTQVAYQDRVFFQENVFFADESFFRLFSFPLTDGDPATALKGPNKAVISEKLAAQYFGRENPLGKPLTLTNNQGRHVYQVSAVFKDIPQNTHLAFDMLLSYQTLVSIDPEAAGGKNWNAFLTYVRVNPGTGQSALEAKLPSLIKKYYDAEELRKANLVLNFHLVPVTDIHLYSSVRHEVRVNGNATTVNFLLIIAFLIILISWINYINLSTVRAIERAKEVGIRKAIGSSRMSLIWQFLLESVVVNLIALVLAVVVFFFLQDAYSRLVGKPIGFNVLSDPRLQLTLAGMLVMGTLCSGLYPALVLSGYQPIQVLKGKLTSTRKGFYLRNSLITFQYGASIIMTAGTLMVFKQLSFIQTQNLGIDIDQTLVLKVPSTMESDSIFANKMTTLHNEMRNYAQISETSLSTSVPGEELTWVIGGVRPVASSADMEKQYYGIGVDYHFLNAFGLKLTAGRYFREEANADFNSVVITQEAAKQLGYAKPEEAVNQMIRNWNDAQFRIVGVIGDFNQLSLKSEFKPIILFCQPGSRKYISLKLASDQVKETLPAVQAVWQKVFPGSPFNYFFLDDYFAQQYKSDLQFEKIIGLFSMLTILVTCIGIFGVSYFTTLQRVKEISIRKVMGASTRSILLLMFWKFTKLVLFSSIVALPVAGLLINKWLENYAFRTHVALWMFALPVCGILVLTFLIVSYFSHWVGQVKPIQALKND